MFDNLLNLINNEKVKIVNEIKEMAKRRNNIFNVYHVIKPKDKVQVSNLVLFLEKPYVLEKCLNEVYIVNDFGLDEAIGVIESYKGYIDYQKNIEKLNKKAGLNIKGIANTSEIKRRILNSGNKSLLLFLSQLEENDKKIKEKYENAINILEYMASRIVSEYEELYLKREALKEEKKLLSFAHKSILKKEKLMPSEISALIKMINDAAITNEDKAKLIGELNTYIKLTNEVQKEKATIKHVEKKLVNYYVDKNNYQEDLVKEKKEDNFLYENYLNTIRSFSDYESISLFLDSLSKTFNIETFINNISDVLGDADEDIFIKESFFAYLSQNCLKEESFKEEHNKRVNVFYYDFFNDKNKIIEDIEKSIPQAYYKDVLKGLSLIKTNNCEGKKSAIDSIKKVLKLRINDIRIAYKKISSDTYIILGVFCKKDGKGYKIIDSIRRRNNDLMLKESVVEQASMVENFWNSFLKRNEEYEEEIQELLNSKIKL